MTIAIPTWTRILVLVPALAFIAACGGPTTLPITTVAPTVASHELALPLSAADVASMLAIEGQSAVRLDEDSVVLRQGDLQLLVFLEDGGNTLQAVLPYHGLTAGDPLRIARWNATRRFGRAYLDHEQAPTLASDLLLEDGAPVALVQSWSRLVLAMADVFREEVWPVATERTP